MTNNQQNKNEIIMKETRRSSSLLRDLVSTLTNSFFLQQHPNDIIPCLNFISWQLKNQATNFIV